MLFVLVFVVVDFVGWKLLILCFDFVWVVVVVLVDSFAILFWLRYYFHMFLRF